MKRLVLLLTILTIISVRAFPADGLTELPLASTPVAASAASAPALAPAISPLRSAAPVEPSTFDKVFRVMAWPGGKLNRDQSKLERTQAWMWGVERGPFAFDNITTFRSLSTPPFIPEYVASNGLRYASQQGPRETDSLYTQFGNRNIAGVLGSASAFDVVFSYFSSAIPRWTEHKWGGHKWGRRMVRAERLASIGFAGYLSTVHVWYGVRNIQVADRYMGNYRRYQAGLPPIVGH